MPTRRGPPPSRTPASAATVDTSSAAATPTAIADEQVEEVGALVERQARDRERLRVRPPQSPSPMNST